MAPLLDKGSAAPPEKITRARVIEIVVWVAFFCVCSVSMSIVNKKASKALPMTFTLVLSQNFVSLLLALTVGGCVGPANAAFGFRQPLTRDIAVRWLPAASIFTLQLVSSLYALQMTSVATTIVFRALTPHFSAIIDLIFFKRSLHWRTWLSLFAILAGAIIFLAENPTVYPLPGYLWSVVNLLCASTYSVYVKFVINKIGPTTMDLVKYNNLLSLPLLACFLWVDNLGEFGHYVEEINDHGSNITCVGKHAAEPPCDGLGWMWIVLSLVIAGTISFAGFGLARAVTAVTLTVTQHSTKIVTMIISLPVFHDVFTSTMWGAVVVTFAGTAWYSYERMRVTSATANEGPKESSELLASSADKRTGCLGCFECA